MPSPTEPDPAAIDAARHLAQIREVIARSRAERVRSGDIYLVWGLVILAAEATMLLGNLFGWPWGWLAFPLGTPVGVAYSAYAGSRRDQRWSTFGSRVEARLWILVTAAMGALGLGFWSGVFGLQAIVPLVSSLVGVAMGASGALFDSRALTWGGSLFVAVAGAACLVDLLAQHALFTAAIAVGYVGPAIAMLRDERRRDG